MRRNFGSGTFLAVAIRVLSVKLGEDLHSVRPLVSEAKVLHRSGLTFGATFRSWSGASEKQIRAEYFLFASVPFLMTFPRLGKFRS
jgi:hypothetical protein